LKILFNEVINAWLGGAMGRIKIKDGIGKLKSLSKTIKDIEKREGLTYPPVRITPSVKVLYHEYDVKGIVHGNINFMWSGDVIQPIVELSYPFLIYADKKTWKGVLVHELLHYFFLAKKYLDSDIFSLSQYFGGTVIGRLVFDEVYMMDPRKVLRDDHLIELVTKQLEKLLSKKEFLNKIIKWIKSGKPHIQISSQDFYIKLSFSEFKKLYFPAEILNRVRGVK